ncbi:helix-turn-helix transcriptional regulator [Limnothrix sp. FACHB-708]|uniref:helix-turn-helix domain-containing protein n=1 Tax=unclassified Limnothrix TaxID=2632864 RepID=UPI001687D38B|nr:MULTISPECIES: helix-turn-helix transcriptional regulator [unclassified Limnothrix]MBD2553554.1 helix-turn-helix transcriptional regulator [Limnothrix sp. FACHB-708]MBD2590593.1 helix-turn-helix transcriptional regulator [Limnothrix sp. FACHB-406]
MGRAGQALRAILKIHNISQNRLAIELGLRRSVPYRWVHGLSDPTGATIVAIVTALKRLNPEAARDFVRLYLGEIVE